MIGKDKKFGLAKKPEKEDVIINEVMFEPAANREEYLELFNRSDKILDLHNMRIRMANQEERWKEV